MSFIVPPTRTGLTTSHLDLEFSSSYGPAAGPAQRPRTPAGISPVMKPSPAEPRAGSQGLAPVPSPKARSSVSAGLVGLRFPHACEHLQTGLCLLLLLPPTHSHTLSSSESIESKARQKSHSPPRSLPRAILIFRYLFPCHVINTNAHVHTHTHTQILYAWYFYAYFPERQQPITYTPTFR